MELPYQEVICLILPWRKVASKWCGMERAIIIWTSWNCRLIQQTSSMYLLLNGASVCRDSIHTSEQQKFFWTALFVDYLETSGWLLLIQGWFKFQISFLEFPPEFPYTVRILFAPKSHFSRLHFPINIWKNTYSQFILISAFLTLQLCLSGWSEQYINFCVLPSLHATKCSSNSP